MMIMKSKRQMYRQDFCKKKVRIETLVKMLHSYTHVVICIQTKMVLKILILTSNIIYCILDNGTTVLNIDVLTEMSLYPFDELKESFNMYCSTKV